MKTLTIAAAGTTMAMLDWVSTAAPVSLGWLLISYSIFWIELRHELLVKWMIEGLPVKIVMRMIVWPPVAVIADKRHD